MIDALIHFDWTWTPGFRGVLVVAVAVLVLCGSVFVILATNSGARLGFQLALTGFCGWMFVMGIIWSIYGIGWKGEAPTWKVVDTVRSTTGSNEVDSRIDVARTLPLPDELDDPVELRDASKELTKAYPPTQRDPSLGDLVTVDTKLHDRLNKQAKPWRILESSNKYTGETQAVVAEALGPNGQNVFEASTDYQVIESFVTGGRKPASDDSIAARAVHEVTQTFEVKPDEFYAVVQIQQVIPQETRAGQAPPVPVRDETQPVISVVMKRVNGHLLRVPAMAMTLIMGIATAVLCNMLHRRDKLAQAQRAAAAGAS